jgi:hypothetical protein
MMKGVSVEALLWRTGSLGIGPYRNELPRKANWA